MTHEGPALEVLLRRLLETPVDFLAEPATAGGQGIHVDAVIADLERGLGRVPVPASLAPFAATQAKEEKNRLSMALLLVWLLHDEWFHEEGRAAPWELTSTLDELAGDFASVARARAYLDDPDRREEMARALLARFDLRPAGETPAQARDRLSGISAVERKRFLAASRAAEERAQAIREALARKAAAEAADKYTRE